MNQGYIKLYRELMEWEWWSDNNVLKLWIYCLLKANHKPTKYQGINIDRGEFITSRKQLALSTKLSEQQVRTALEKLISTNNITKHQPSKNHTIIRVLEYDKYQSNQPFNQPSTNHQPTYNNDNNDNKYNNPNVCNYISVRARTREEEKRLFAPRVKLKRG